MRTAKTDHRERMVRAEILWPILMFLQKRYGFDSDLFLSARGLDMRTLQGKETQVNARYLAELYEEATRFTDDPNLSFKLGEWANPHSLGVFGYLLLHSRDINEALQKLCRYYPLIGRSLKPLLDETQNRYKLSFMFSHAGELIPLGKYQSEIHLSAALSLINKIASEKITPEYATFRHSLPNDLSEYRRVFGNKLYFDETENALIFSKEALAIKTLYENPSLLQMFEKEAETYLGMEISGGFKEEISGLILVCAGELDFSLETVALKAKIHPRLLQKRLKAEGSSHTQLLKEVRKKLSARYLREKIDISTVAVYLGYSEPSAFIRAFKQWYGMTPGEWTASQSGQSR
ncbi:AraC family transcriptional regulator [uncultured Sulfuricurvum sp.]|uniref:AraC family transcriptional regulator n=1 Tax=uncultured Sulfuricurvum sp. TaxID=430693 RepID=UPI002618665C|nr:AraC family transcriptional regulator [uncultured Sulfuricurvum sp.]